MSTSRPDDSERYSSTASNVEKSGERNFMALSSAARRVDRVYHYDLDLFQVCKRCFQPQVFMEATSSKGFKNTSILREIATKFEVPAILIRHEFGDEDHAYPIDIHYWNPGILGYDAPPTRSLYGVSWGTLISTLEGLRDRHEC